MVNLMWSNKSFETHESIIFDIISELYPCEALFLESCARVIRNTLCPKQNIYKQITHGVSGPLDFLYMFQVAIEAERLSAA